jgi:hypothetical protein
MKNVSARDKNNRYLNEAFYISCVSSEDLMILPWRTKAKNTAWNDLNTVAAVEDDSNTG